MKWFTKNNFIRNVGRQSARNIVEGEISPLEPSKYVTTLFEAWHLSVIDELSGKIVTNINRKISEFRETVQSTTKYTYYKTTHLNEIKAFYGL